MGLHFLGGAPAVIYILTSERKLLREGIRHFLFWWITLACSLENRTADM
jgi:hypothetical protein